MDKYVERLVKEWKEHGKLIIAVDFDSTIYPWGTIENTEDLLRTISAVHAAIEVGARIVINTCSDPSRYTTILTYCEYLSIPVESINKNPIELPYGNFNKVYANIYLDDRAGLIGALEILEKATQEMKKIIKN